MQECLVRCAIAEVFRFNKLHPGRLDDLIAADVSSDHRCDGGGVFHHLEQLKPESLRQSRGYGFLGLRGCPHRLLNVQHELPDLERGPSCHFPLQDGDVGHTLAIPKEELHRCAGDQPTAHQEESHGKGRS